MIRSLSLTILCAILMACAQRDGDGGGLGPTEGPPRTPDSVYPHDMTLEEMLFSTRAYQHEALRLVLQEANQVAQQLELPETLPITETNMDRAFIAPYGTIHMHRKAIGNVHTKNYGYFVSIDHKLSYVRHASYDEACSKWRSEYVWPVSRLDTNGAYQLATQWLAAVSMDVKGLNRDCKVLIRQNPYWNGGMKKRTFVPIYDVHWLSAENQANNYGDVAYVCLFAPTKTLISLNVSETKYILRDRVVFTNLNQLLSKPEEKSLAPPE